MIEALGTIPLTTYKYQDTQFVLRDEDEFRDLQPDLELIIKMDGAFETYNIIEADDIVLRLTDLQNDHKSLRVGLSTEKGIITSAYVTLRNKSDSLPKYLYYYLHSYDIAKGFYGMGAGVRQGLNWEELKHLKLCRPSISEQQEIIAFLDKKCTEIDILISKKEQFLTELESYKKSMIYEYVTGKKEVPQS